MDIYKKRSYWKAFLVVVGLLIVIFSVNYIRSLAKKIAEQEKEKAEVIAQAYLNINYSDSDLTEALEIIQGNELIPVIYTYEDRVAVFNSNYDSTKVANPKFLGKQVKKLGGLGQVIELDFDGENHYLYYGDSALLRKVKMYPFFQLGLIGLFMMVSYVAFNASRRAEQNRVWVGMAKETAHQLGTPLSSIATWIDILKDKWSSEAEEMEILNDLDKDVQRLELVADRFSKIGSPPKLTEQALKPLVHKVVNYISKRASAKVDVNLIDKTSNEIIVLMNTSLMDWVLENLMKNALDAIENSGKIDVFIKDKGEIAVIEIADSGKGIPKSRHQTIFEPGFSTKKRGWGLGLTLVKRIVEQYHSGKVFVKQSIPGNGTIFRIELKKA